MSRAVARVVCACLVHGERRAGRRLHRGHDRGGPDPRQVARRRSVPRSARTTSRSSTVRPDQTRCRRDGDARAHRGGAKELRRAPPRRRPRRRRRACVWARGTRPPRTERGSLGRRARGRGAERALASEDPLPLSRCFSRAELEAFGVDVDALTESSYVDLGYESGWLYKAMGPSYAQSPSGRRAERGRALRLPPVPLPVAAGDRARRLVCARVHHQPERRGGGAGGVDEVPVAARAPAAHPLRA